MVSDHCSLPIPQKRAIETSMSVTRITESAEESPAQEVPLILVWQSSEATVVNMLQPYEACRQWPG